MPSVDWHGTGISGRGRGQNRLTPGSARGINREVRAARSVLCSCGLGSCLWEVRAAPLGLHGLRSVRPGYGVLVAFVSAPLSQIGVSRLLPGLLCVAVDGPGSIFRARGGEAELQRRAPSHSVPVNAAVSAVLFVA